MTPSLVGGIGFSRVLVYSQQAAPDGCQGGCPHMHAITEEAYYVTRGRGRVELHDEQHGFRTVRLEAGTYLDFQPRVLHRLINDGELELLAIMGNAGLAEAGDARIYFGKEVDASLERYSELWSLPQRLGLAGALERRDHAVRAYLQLMALWKENRPAYDQELARFVRKVLESAAQKKSDFLPFVEAGPLAAGRRAQGRLETVPAPLGTPLVRYQAEETHPGLGMCGHLYRLTGVTQLP
jgi:mannose-6-phosphate isomerase-like protein (cupin superfamily)